MKQAGKEVSLQHQLEEELQESQRLRTLRELASGLAHDISNTLAAVVGQSELLLHQVSDGTLRSPTTGEPLGRDVDQNRVFVGILVGYPIRWD